MYLYISIYTYKEFNYWRAKHLGTLEKMDGTRKFDETWMDCSPISSNYICKRTVGSQPEKDGFFSVKK
jgi:hypothetical protein